MSDDSTTFNLLPPDPELRRLQPFVGSWRSEGHTHDSGDDGGGG